MVKIGPERGEALVGCGVEARGKVAAHQALLHFLRSSKYHVAHTNAVRVLEDPLGLLGL